MDVSIPINFSIMQLTLFSIFFSCNTYDLKFKIIHFYYFILLNQICLLIYVEWKQLFIYNRYSFTNQFWLCQFSSNYIMLKYMLFNLLSIISFYHNFFPSQYFHQSFSQMLLKCYKFIQTNFYTNQKYIIETW